jgi:pilus assembly protein TadC
MTDVTHFVWLGEILILLLFGALLVLVIYVIRSSQSERSQLVGILAQYAESLQEMAEILKSLSDVVSDVERRIERMEFSRTSVSVSSIGERASVGQVAQGWDLTQRKDE